MLSLSSCLQDHSSQEAAVKIQLLERRVETVKQQAEAIEELETEAARAKRQERTLEDNLELVKTELDQAQQEVAKLKQTQADPDKRSAPAFPPLPPLDRARLTCATSCPFAPAAPGIGSSPAIGDLAIDGASLETHHLLEQLGALRGAVQYLRHENALLQSRDLLAALPTLPRRNCFPPLPTLDPASPSGSAASSLPEEDEDEDDAGPTTPGRNTPDLHRLETETTLLFREVGRFSASPKVVDLTTIMPPVAGSKLDRWMPRSKRPEAALEQRKLEGERLDARVQALKEKTARARTAQARLRYGF